MAPKTVNASPCLKFVGTDGTSGSCGFGAVDAGTGLYFISSLSWQPRDPSARMEPRRIGATAERMGA